MSESDTTTEDFKKNLEDLNSDSRSLAEVSSNEAKRWLSEEQTLQIIDDLVVGFDLDKRTTFSAMCLLFKKGAANAGTPTSLSVEVIGKNYHGTKNRTATILKKDLVYYYEK